MGWTVRGSNSCKGKKFCRSSKRQNRFCDSHSLLFNRYRGSSSGVKWPERYVATNLCLTPRFKMSGPVPLLPLYSFMRWTGRISFFYLYRILMIIRSVDQQILCLIVYIRIHVTWFLSSYIVRGTKVYFRPKFQTVQTSMILCIEYNLWKLKFISDFYKILVPTLQGTRHFSIIKVSKYCEGKPWLYILELYETHTSLCRLREECWMLNVADVCLPAWGERFFDSPKMSRPNMGPSQPPITNDSHFIFWR